MAGSFLIYPSLGTLTLAAVFFGSLFRLTWESHREYGKMARPLIQEAQAAVTKYILHLKQQGGLNHFRTTNHLMHEFEHWASSGGWPSPAATEEVYKKRKMRAWPFLRAYQSLLKKDYDGTLGAIEFLDVTNVADTRQSFDGYVEWCRKVGKKPLAKSDFKRLVRVWLKSISKEDGVPAGKKLIVDGCEREEKLEIPFVQEICVQVPYPSLIEVFLTIWLGVVGGWALINFLNLSANWLFRLLTLGIGGLWSYSACVGLTKAAFMKVRYLRMITMLRRGATPLVGLTAIRARWKRKTGIEFAWWLLTLPMSLYTWEHIFNKSPFASLEIIDNKQFEYLLRQARSQGLLVMGYGLPTVPASDLREASVGPERPLVVQFIAPRFFQSKISEMPSVQTTAVGLIPDFQPKRRFFTRVA